MTLPQDDYSEFADLFDPKQAPGRKPGTIGDIEATEAEVAAAKANLARRQSLYSWRRLTSDDLERIGQVTAEMVRVEMDKPEADVKKQKVAALQEFAAALAEQDAVEHSFKRDLPFYRKGVLLHISYSEQRPAWRAVLISPDDADDRAPDGKQNSNPTIVILDGTSLPIHRDLNAEFLAEGWLRFIPGASEEYLAFFCEHVHGDLGPFGIIEFESTPPEDVAGLTPVAFDMQPDDVKAKVAQPITRIVRGQAPQVPADLWLATIVYGTGCFRASFRLEPDGSSRMLEDQEVEGVALIHDPKAWQGPKRLKDGSEYRPPEPPPQLQAAR